MSTMLFDDRLLTLDDLLGHQAGLQAQTQQPRAEERNARGGEMDRLGSVLPEALLETGTEASV